MQLYERQDQFSELDVAVLVVTFDPLAAAEAYVKATSLEWPLLVDESRSLYEQYGMGAASLGKLLGPSVWWAGIKLLLKGRRLAKPGRDLRQLGGDVLIDPNGIIRLCHLSSGPTDRPSVEGILEIARGT